MLERPVLFLASDHAAIVGPGRHERWATILHENPLSIEALESVIGHPVAALPAPSRAIIWTGWTGETEFDFDLRSWSKASWEALVSFCDHFEQAKKPAGTRLLLRPHARHVLSDVQRIESFFGARAGGSIGLLLDPASLIEPAMLPRLPDHLRRIIETLGPRAEAIWLAGIESPHTDDHEDAGPVCRAGLHAGEPGSEWFARALEQWVPPATPLVLEGDPAPQIAGLIRSR